MPTKSDDEQKKPDSSAEPFRGVGEYVESGNVVGLVRELDKVPTDAKEAILNRISMSDGKGGHIELDSHQIVPMPKAMREQVKQRRLEQGDTT